MSSNSSSGGMKEMVRLFLKRESRTYWWNFIFFSFIDLFLLFEGRRVEGGMDFRF